MFDMTGSNILTGDIAASQSLRLISFSGVHHATTATTDFVNSGLIRLEANSNGFDVQLIRDGLITNALTGVIRFEGDSSHAATDRILDAELHNFGLIDVAIAGANAQIGSNSLTHVMSHVNSGVILNQGSTLKILGESFVNEAGGLLAGNGILDFTGTGLLNEGSIAPGLSAGQLELKGLIEFAATADFQIELGGFLSSEFDWISISDSLLLDGALSVSFIDDFQNSILSTDTFLIVDSISTTGIFAGLVDGSRFNTTDGFGSFQINYVGNDVVLGNFLSSVPEPGGLLPLAGFSLVLAFRRRRVSRYRGTC
jgi:uncharacterized protein (TIGR03382 family)